MSDLQPYLALACNEVGNVVRTTTYDPCLFNSCPCPALGEDYVSPETDPSPWYDASHPESANFYGFLPQSITLSPPFSREVSAIAGEGSLVGPEKLSGVVIEAVGWMIATDAHAMWWGRRWLSEVLRGNRCQDGCAGDTVEVLPFCRDDGTAEDFRTLVGAGLVDGPRWSPLLDEEGYLITMAQFQIATSMPYLYQAPERCLDDEPIAGTLACLLTTPEWSDGTFVIDITNTGTTPSTDIVISGRISLDGSCPVTGLGTSVPPSWTYLIPSLGPEDRIVIDGMRRKPWYYDASCKTPASALPYIDFTGAFPHPDVGSCTDMCLTIEQGGGGSAIATVDAVLRDV